MDFSQKIERFSEQDIFSSNVTRKNKSVLENLVHTIWTRCTLYFLVSFASSRRAVSSSIDLDDKSDKYVGGFLRGTSSFRWEFGVPDVRISFKPVQYQFHLSTEISVLVRRRHSHSSLRPFPDCLIGQNNSRETFRSQATNRYKMLRAGARPTTHRDRPPSHPAKMAVAENAVEKHELRRYTTTTVIYSQPRPS